MATLLELEGFSMFMESLSNTLIYAIYVARLEAPRYSRRSLNMNQLGEVLDCSLKIG